MEIENVVRQHPGVAEVAVTGIPHPEDGELPVACVVKQKGCNVTAKDIENMVEGKNLIKKIFLLRYDYIHICMYLKLNCVKLKAMGD